MFTTLIVQPIFNVLVLIYALIPGHNFGLAIILFTIVTRFLFYPMLKKQLKHTKSMRELAPEIKKIKAATKGNKQQESLMTMELYKEREIKPMAYLGLMVIQLILFLALFSGLNKVVKDPNQLVDFSYKPIQSMSAMVELKEDISKFDNTLFGVVDLGRAAVKSGQPFYFPAFLLVLGSALIQFFQIKQTMPSDKNARKLRDILKEANTGTNADSSEVNAAMGRNMAYFMPVMIFVLTIGFPGALSLYWFVGGLIAYVQQTNLLKQDEYAIGHIPKATVISKKSLREEVNKVVEPSSKIKTAKKKTSKKNRKKRR